MIYQKLIHVKLTLNTYINNTLKQRYKLQTNFGLFDYM